MEKSDNRMAIIAHKIKTMISEGVSIVKLPVIPLVHLGGGGTIDKQNNIPIAYQNTHWVSYHTSEL